MAKDLTFITIGVKLIGISKISMCLLYDELGSLNDMHKDTKYESNSKDQAAFLENLDR